MISLTTATSSPLSFSRRMLHATRARPPLSSATATAPTAGVGDEHALRPRSVGPEARELQLMAEAYDTRGPVAL